MMQFPFLVAIICRFLPNRPRCVNLSLYPGCVVANHRRIADGTCDTGVYNSEECGWDGGDCIIPEYPDCHVDYPYFIGDGICNSSDEYNTEDCGYDGGDCCEESCMSNDSDCQGPWNSCVDPEYMSDHTPISGGQNSPSPASPTLGPVDSSSPPTSSPMTAPPTTASPSPEPTTISPTPQPTTSTPTMDPTKDPTRSPSPEPTTSSPTLQPTTSTPTMDPTMARTFTPGDASFPNCGVSFPDWLGDGQCDFDHEGYNTEECGYDGGDCCEESCKPGDVDDVNSFFDCQGPWFFCVDPTYAATTATAPPTTPPPTTASPTTAAPTPTPRDASFPNCGVDFPEWLGDGQCDFDSTGYNTEECGYDGGDCCEESCKPGGIDDVDSSFDCQGPWFFCVDPKYN